MRPTLRWCSFVLVIFLPGLWRCWLPLRWYSFVLLIFLPGLWRCWLPLRWYSFVLVIFLPGLWRCWLPLRWHSFVLVISLPVLWRCWPGTAHCVAGGTSSCALTEGLVLMLQRHKRRAHEQRSCKDLKSHVHACMLRMQQPRARVLAVCPCPRLHMTAHTDLRTHARIQVRRDALLDAPRAQQARVCTA